MTLFRHRREISVSNAGPYDPCKTLREQALLVENQSDLCKGVGELSLQSELLRINRQTFYYLDSLISFLFV